MLAELMPKCSNLIILGDLNFHWSNMQNSLVEILEDSIFALGMQQLVDVPTHKNGNILDVIMMEEMSSANIVNTVVGDFLSDHKFVSTSVEFIKKGSELKNVKARDLKNIDVNLLNSQLKLISLDNNLDTNEIANQLEDQLCRVLDDIAPEKEKLRFDRNPKPWFDDSVSLARSHYKKCKKSWSKTKCEVDWQAVWLSRNQYTRALQTAKRIFTVRKLLKVKEIQKVCTLQ